ncbi:heparinase II/III family protein [Qipengyuania sp. NPDC077410]|uniref:heparinase II/III family protein n=1 Tax=Qipengyuania sp. NPDC077410 TaxID=3364496 RepID=UPI0037CB503E
MMPARRRASLTGPDSFSFLNEDGSLAIDGWDNPKREKLWRYNQHYFDDLNAIGAASRRDWHATLIAAWLTDNPAGSGSGFEPYPTSLRIVNWVKWLLGGGNPPRGMLDSLALQTRWLCKRLEYHLLGNHLFANAKALIFSGMFFDGAESAHWLKLGLAILQREFDEQILSDGGHFELSPMYHALGLEDVLDLINLTCAMSGALEPAQSDQVAHWRRRVPQMVAWLRAMSHPDGEIAFFNDAALAIAPENDELFEYARRLDLEVPHNSNAILWLEQSGYVRLENETSVVIADMARIGPDYLPGHAHADTLSFEWSLFSERVIVNSGTSLYGLGEERLRQRGTPAHSTVTIARQNSSDVWSGFRVGARARPIGPSSSVDGETLIAECSHDGYRSLPGRPIHHRRWELRPGALKIFDTACPSDHSAEARFHFHPDVCIEQRGLYEGELILAGGGRVSWRAEGGPLRSERSTWHPEFGRSLRSTCLVLRLLNGSSIFELTWSGRFPK